MMQRVCFGAGAVVRVGRILDLLDARHVLVVRGKDSYTASGASVALAPALKGRSVEFFSEFLENPRFEDVGRGVEVFHGSRCQAVVAVGGGSVLDMAKLVSGLALAEDPLAVIQGRAPIGRLAAPLIAVPTTSGSGSEATHFAVVYVDGAKHSLTDARLLPAWAVVDPILTHSLPARTTAVSGIDAFSQAVESSWSIHSSSASRAWAARAIALAVEHLPAAVNSPTPLARRMMSKASHLAGRAINVTKTTAAHALSYPLTMRYGVPHGQAVCLTLGGLLVFNDEVTAEDVTDPRGVSHVRRAIEDIGRLLGCDNARSAAARIDALIRSIGLSTSLDALNVPCKDAVDHAVAGVNLERLGNNPRRLRERDLRDLLESVCCASE